MRWILEAAGAKGSLDRNDEVPGEVVSVATDLVTRRAAGEPLQYLTGLAGFRMIELEVGPGVLIPRPETEIVVGHALRVLPGDGTIVDVGTGSGAIALAVKTERPDARVFATDASEEALRWAERNRARLDLEVTLLCGDLLDPLPASLRERVDVIVSNPPYVALDEGENLPVEVVAHEPHQALFAGPGGLEVIGRVAAQAGAWLKPGGWLVLEIGAGQAEEVTELLVGRGFDHVETYEDLAGRDRVAVGRRP